ncbi:DUF397 domain-containing protein [Streptomyces uncialis]|uniref:DUF397 domain-containing protein n=1 Tax=Streptomyces uncialis TaxID=1048205 RepID=UPI00364B01FA
MNHVARADTQLGGEAWRKPWSSSNGGNCLEVKQLGDGRVALRQSTDPDGPVLLCPAHDIAALVRAIKTGQADFLLT